MNNKEMRLHLITQLISEYEVNTQEELQHLLYKKGLKVTQATISRDVHSLKLIKVQSKNGILKYSLKKDQEYLIWTKLQHILRDAFVSIEVITFLDLSKLM